MALISYPDPISVLNSREKYLDGYSYKLMEGQFAIDAILPAKMDMDESKMSVWIPFADGSRRDGVGDLLEVGGIRTERHQGNPISLFDHGKKVDLPVGMCCEWDGDRYDKSRYTVELDPINQKARANVFFYQGKGLTSLAAEGDRTREMDHAVFCEQLYHMLNVGLISAGSFGYQVIKATQLSPDYQMGTPQGLHLLNTLLLEVSPVVLPANQDTVRKTLAMPRMCGKPLSPYLVKSLSCYAPAETKTVVGFADVVQNKSYNLLEKTDTTKNAGGLTCAVQGKPTGTTALGKGCGDHKSMKSLRAKYRKGYKEDYDAAVRSVSGPFATEESLKLLDEAHWAAEVALQTGTGYDKPIRLLKRVLSLPTSNTVKQQAQRQLQELNNAKRGGKSLQVKSAAKTPWYEESYKPGDPIKFVSGPYKGKEGVIVEFNTNTPTGSPRIVAKFDGKQEPVDRKEIRHKNLVRTKGVGDVSKIMFRWNDQPKSNSELDRKLWIETGGGDRQLLTFADLDRRVGRSERERLVRVAIRRGTGKWHPSDAVAVMALAGEKAIKARKPKQQWGNQGSATATRDIMYRPGQIGKIKAEAQKLGITVDHSSDFAGPGFGSARVTGPWDKIQKLIDFALSAKGLIRFKYRKSYKDNFLESRDDYKNKLSDGTVPAPNWSPGLGSKCKSLPSQGKEFTDAALAKLGIHVDKGNDRYLVHVYGDGGGRISSADYTVNKEGAVRLAKIRQATGFSIGRKGLKAQIPGDLNWLKEEQAETEHKDLGLYPSRNDLQLSYNKLRNSGVSTTSAIKQVEKEFGITNVKVSPGDEIIAFRRPISISSKGMTGRATSADYQQFARELVAQHGTTQAAISDINNTIKRGRISPMEKVVLMKTKRELEGMQTKARKGLPNASAKWSRGGVARARALHERMNDPREKGWLFEIDGYARPKEGMTEEVKKAIQKVCDSYKVRVGIIVDSGQRMTYSNQPQTVTYTASLESKANDKTEEAHAIKRAIEQAVQPLSTGVGGGVAIRQTRKSLPNSLRKRYRPVKSLRRRLRKSVPGAGVVYVRSKNVEQVREIAEGKGLKFQHMKSEDGVAKVKLMGTDEAIDELAKGYALPLRSVKSLNMVYKGRKGLGWGNWLLIVAGTLASILGIPNTMAMDALNNMTDELEDMYEENQNPKQVAQKLKTRGIGKSLARKKGLKFTGVKTPAYKEGWNTYLRDNDAGPYLCKYPKGSKQYNEWVQGMKDAIEADVSGKDVREL